MKFFKVYEKGIVKIQINAYHIVSVNPIERTVRLSNGDSLAFDEATMQAFNVWMNSTLKDFEFSQFRQAEG